MTNNIILSLDQATTSGYAVSINSELVDFGTYTTDKNDYDDKINDVKIFTKQLIDKYKPCLITVEGVQFQTNQQIYGKLSRLQGVLINYFIENEILHSVITPSQWKGKHGIKGRKRVEQKENAMKKVKELGIDCDSEDACEAILMNLYAREFIKIKYEKE